MNLSEINQHAELNFLESAKAVSENNHQKVFIIARPILVFLSNFFIIPKKVRGILGHLVEVMDLLTNLKDADSPLSV